MIERKPTLLILIITFLNLKRKDIAKYGISTVDDTIYYSTTLIRKSKAVPYHVLLDVYSPY